MLGANFTTAFFGATILAAVFLGIQHIKSRYFDLQPFEEVCAKLGAPSSVNILMLIYYSGTLNQRSIWANIKISGVSNRANFFIHLCQIFENLDSDKDFLKASKILFGKKLSYIDRIFYKHPIISQNEGIMYLLSQLQELYGRKRGQERADAFGALDELEEAKEELKSSLKGLGMIDSKAPNGDEDIIIIPGSSMRGMLGKLVYVENLRRNKIINPKQIVIATGDRDLSEGLDSSLNLYIIDSVRKMLDDKKPQKDFERFLSQNYKKRPFTELTNDIEQSFDENNLQKSIKLGDKSSISPLSETGGILYLINKLNLDTDLYSITHTAKYPDNSRPDTESTAHTLTSYIKEAQFKVAKIGITAFQPYIKRQTEIFEAQLLKELDSTKHVITAFGPQYNFWEAKRAMSEFSGYVFERAKRHFKLSDIEKLMFTHPNRAKVNVHDMPKA